MYTCLAKCLGPFLGSSFPRMLIGSGFRPEGLGQGKDDLGRGFGLVAMVGAWARTRLGP